MAGGISEWGGATSSSPVDGITAEMVDEIARKHYPMCMRHLHEGLRRDRHLKHFGRLQYGLFLKVSFEKVTQIQLTKIETIGAGAIDRRGYRLLEKVV